MMSWILFFPKGFLGVQEFSMVSVGFLGGGGSQEFSEFSGGVGVGW